MFEFRKQLEHLFAIGLGMATGFWVLLVLGTLTHSFTPSEFPTLFFPPIAMGILISLLLSNLNSNRLPLKP